MKATMKAYVLEGSPDEVHGAVRELETSALPAGDVTIKVEYSSINFKDAMVNAGVGRMVRNLPHVPGIDFSGEVVEDGSGRFAAGDKVSLTGYEVGLGHFGGYGELARVPADWVVKLPEGLDTFEASALGTAGFTAMLGLLAMERAGMQPGQGPVLVTGASGGVGATGVEILSLAGYEVAAGTGKADQHALLEKLGAKRFLTREEMVDESGKVLLREEWAGGLDQVGGKTLEYLLRTTRLGGSVALTGNVGGNAFSTTVLPFILRGVNLLGVDSQHCPMALREEAWAKLGGGLKPTHLKEIAQVISLDELPEKLPKVLAGEARGRYVVKIG